MRPNIFNTCQLTYRTDRDSSRFSALLPGWPDQHGNYSLSFLAGNSSHCFACAAPFSGCRPACPNCRVGISSRQIAPASCPSDPAARKDIHCRCGIGIALALFNVGQSRMILPSAHVLMVEGVLRLPTRPGSTHTFRPNKRWHCA
jgi:hypothetical protein